jgi:hypothetical protein
MKSLSPWFQTAHLLNGIRETVSEIESARATDDDEEQRVTSPAERDQSRD